jgi:nitroimidazol reductase NimA-like FMN-containing flavoprotein (pyridoxamine 5'-phosphate oxidase superfamily)
MTLDEETELADEEIDAFLSRSETGVLSLAQDDKPYSVPISYGYDATTRRFYLRLVSTPESEKRRFLESNPIALLVVLEGDDDMYRSVIESGTLESIPRKSLSVEHIEKFGEAKRPLFEVWEESRKNLDVELYVLDSDSLDGRRIEVSH